MTVPPRTLPATRDAADAGRLGPWTEALWTAVEDGDEPSALDIAQTALAAGIDPEAVLLDVIGAVQRRAGEEWAANRMSVTREHLATAISDRVVGAVARHPAVALPPGAPVRGRVTVACVEGEWHAMPARLLAEVLRGRGWRVDFLGAQVPARHLVPHLHLTGPDVVALSASLATRLPTAHTTITACRAAGVPVIAGGAAFGPAGRYARLLGADGWAPDARAAADLLDARPPAPPAPAGPAFDGLPHLADQEYTAVTRGAPGLVRETLTGLEARVPAVRAYSAQERQHAAEDVAHLVDHLGAALYTDDDELFRGYLRWTAAVLDGRGAPPGVLRPALEVLAVRLVEFPRAVRVLDAGVRALAAAPRVTAAGDGGPA